MKETSAESVLEKTFEYLREIIADQEEHEHEAPAPLSDNGSPQDDQDLDSDR